MFRIDWKSCEIDQDNVTVEIRFYRGPRDGEVLRGTARQQEVTEVDGVLWQTCGGQLEEKYFTLSEQVRRAFHGVRCADLPLQVALGMIPFSHCYEVTARLPRGDCIHLHLEHRGASD